MTKKLTLNVSDEFADELEEFWADKADRTEAMLSDWPVDVQTPEDPAESALLILKREVDCEE
jgi:hypothetical protein